MPDNPQPIIIGTRSASTPSLSFRKPKDELSFAIDNQDFKFQEYFEKISRNRLEIIEKWLTENAADPKSHTVLHAEKSLGKEDGSIHKETLILVPNSAIDHGQTIDVPKFLSMYPNLTINFTAKTI